MDTGLFNKIMLFYAVLTFFVGPKISKMLKLDSKDSCMVGMVLGFGVSLILWKQFGYNMVYKGKSGY